MSGRKPGQHADLRLVSESTGDCHMREYVSRGLDADMLNRKLASKQQVSTKESGMSILVKDGKVAKNEHMHYHRS